MKVNYKIEDFVGIGDQPMIIDGEPFGISGREVTDIHDPATGNKIGTSPIALKTDVERAVDAARRTFDQGIWRYKSAVERQNMLLKVADTLEANAVELARLEALNSGMLLPMAENAIANSVQVVRYYAGLATKLYGQTAEISGGLGQFHAYSVKEPIGVAALIIPWNVPVYLTMVKLAPALAAGCSCIVKPAEETPLTTLMVVRLLHKAGIPPGVVNVVTGGAATGAALVESEKVDKVAFTGSGEVEKRIVEMAAGNLKKLTLELGGKSPVILFEDCDIDAATEAIAGGIFTHAGQICVAGSRLYVQRSIYQQAIDKLSRRADSLKIGHCFASDTQIGPLISERQRSRVESLVRAGAESGGEICAGGAIVEGRGYFYKPTVIANPPKESPVVKKEIFGPVLVVHPFDDMEEAVIEANNSMYGLAASIWSNDINKTHYLAKRIDAGMVWINCHGVADISLSWWLQTVRLGKGAGPRGDRCIPPEQDGVCQAGQCIV